MIAVDAFDIHQYAIHTRDSGCFFLFGPIGGYLVKAWKALNQLAARSAQKIIWNAAAASFGTWNKARYKLRRRRTIIRHILMQFAN